MTTKTLCIATCLVGACALDTPETAEVTSALTNSPATSDHPSVVTISINDGIGDDVVCTAQILTPHWLLTSAHCVNHQAQGSTVRVRGGQNATTTHFTGPGNFTMHPDYDDTFGDPDDDLALIRLSGNGMGLISEQMAVFMGPIDESMDVIVVGYGTGSDPNTSEWCQDGQSGTKREQDYNLNGVDGQSLSIDYGDAKVCEGDSGGPWIIPHADHKFSDGVTSVQIAWQNDAEATRPSAKWAWIRDTLATSATPATCRTFTQVGEQGVSYMSCFEGEQKVRPPALAAGKSHACAVLNDGRARCWGDNQFGQLGDSTLTDRDMPVTVQWTRGATNGTMFDKIAAGWSHSCAVSDLDRVLCWGSNASGQLGGPNMTTGNYTQGQLVRFADGSALTDVRNITAGGMHTCAVTWAGRVYCWGANSRGQLGNDTTTASPVPVLVGQFEDPPNENGLRTMAIEFPRRFIPLEGVIAIEAGYRHTCAIKSDNTAVCWGDNAVGQLGNGTTTNSSRPVKVATLTNVFRISAGYMHTCATYGSAGDRGACWGYNAFGQLGTGTTTNASTPRLITPGLGVAVEVSAGMLHTCFVGNEQQKCSGYNASGELGILSSANQLTLVPSVIEADARVPAAGNEFTCTLLFSGTVACAGRNADGQLAANNLVNQRYFWNVHHLHHLGNAP